MVFNIHNTLLQELNKNIAKKPIVEIEFLTKNRLRFHLVGNHTLPGYTNIIQDWFMRQGYDNTDFEIARYFLIPSRKTIDVKVRPELYVLLKMSYG